ncbi:hypothetical protein UlMin_031777 [Ulmus minor]
MYLGHRKFNVIGKIKKEDQDYLSCLPDEILLLILSRLPLIEAGRTSVLSQRWKNLWSLITSRLDFEAPQRMKDMRWGKKGRKEEKLKYIKWVDQTLSSHPVPEVEELRICFDLNKAFADSIDRWIEFAAEKRVKRFELDLSNIWGAAPLHIYAPNLLMPSAIPREDGNNRFYFLTDLALSCVNVSGEVIESFIANCPSLERLSIQRLILLYNLKVAGPSLKLKFLEILKCNCLGKIEISAPNLVLFKYHADLNLVTIKNAPLLSNVSFGGGIVHVLCYPSCPLFEYFSQLRILELEMPSWVLGVFTRSSHIEIPVLDNLKQLELSTMPYYSQCLLFPCLLIKAAPCLQRFSMKMRFKGLFDNDGEWISRNNFKKLKQKVQYTHKCLEEVELIGFNGETSNVLLGLSLIAIAVNLKKMIIDLRPPLLEDGPWKTFISLDLSKAKKGVKKLQSKIRPGTELVIVE